MPSGSRGKKNSGSRKRRVVNIPKMQKKMGTGKMPIATPSLVDAIICEAPYGKLITANLIRARFAQDLMSTLSVHLQQESLFESQPKNRKRFTA